MNEAVVSVIIPVYKTEAFLDECLNSIIGQDYPALEIILVDDGSPDSCPEMCDRYAEEYSNIKTIHKSNEGPGMARNSGLDAASGKYIAFVDSDDCLDGADAIRQMAERAEKTSADIVVGSFQRLEGKQRSGVNRPHLHDGAYTKTVDFRFKGFFASTHLMNSWSKLYRRSFLTDNDIKFPDYSFSEDFSFNMICCACQAVYAFVDESVYLYRVNPDSISHRYLDYLTQIPIAYDFESFLSEHGITEEYGDLIAFFHCFNLFLLAKQEILHKGISEAVKTLSIYGKDPLVHKMLKRLACGRYIDQIEGKSWKLMIWTASLLGSFHAYALLVLGTWMLMKTKADERLISSKYES